MSRGDPGPGHRLLAPQEVLRAGDEYLATWGRWMRSSRPLGVDADGFPYRRAIRRVEGRPGWRWLDAGEILALGDEHDDDAVVGNGHCGYRLQCDSGSHGWMRHIDGPPSLAERNAATAIEAGAAVDRYEARRMVGSYEINTSESGRIAETLARRAAWDAALDAEMADRATVILSPIDHEDYV